MTIAMAARMQAMEVVNDTLLGVLGSAIPPVLEQMEHNLRELAPIRAKDLTDEGLEHYQNVIDATLKKMAVMLER